MIEYIQIDRVRLAMHLDKLEVEMTSSLLVQKSKKYEILGLVLVLLAALWQLFAVDVIVDIQDRQEQVWNSPGSLDTPLAIL